MLTCYKRFARFNGYLGRDIEDSNMVKLVFDITDLAKAKAAIASDENKKLLQRAGVVGVPDIKFYSQGE